jgi:hypothetical protein
MTYTCSISSMNRISFLKYDDPNHKILYLYKLLRQNNICHYKDMILCQTSIVHMLNFQDICEIHMFLWDEILV